jgi:hypothetical protein
MSTDLEPTPTGGVSNFIANNRAAVGYVTLVLAAVLAAVTVLFVIRSLGPSAKPDGDAPAPTVSPTKAADYLVGWVGTSIATIILASGGIYLAFSPVPPSPAERRTDARQWVLVIGGLLGLFLILFGLIFAYVWRESLVDWVNNGNRKEAWWVLGALGILLAGLGTVAASIQPARAEERNKVWVRRAVYGANAVLAGVVLLLILAVGNVVAALKLPNKLDTTEAGFYSLSPRAKEFLARLDRPVKVYYIIPPRTGEQVDQDTVRLLSMCEEANPDKFKYQVVSPATDQAKVAELRKNYPQLDVRDLGLLVTLEDDEKAAAFIRANELTTTEGGQEAYQGEAKLFTELIFLAESRVQPVVYFTQGHDELDISGAPARAGGRRAAARSASAVKEHLERRRVTVRPLTFELGKARVPDDADVVVVAGPRVPLPPEEVEALRQYMTGGAAGAKKGKLVVLPNTDPDSAGRVQPTGLEGLVSDFGVTISEEFLLGQPMSVGGGGVIPPAVILAVVPPELLDSGNQLANTFQDGVLFQNVRYLTARGGGGQPFRSESLLVSYPSRFTWLEKTNPADPDRVWAELRTSDALRQEKNLSRRTAPILVTVTEPAAQQANPFGPPPTGGSTPRLAVFANSTFASDEQAARDVLNRDLLAYTVDWLRGREQNIGIQPRAYRNYTLKPNVDAGKLLWLPGLLAAVSILGLGASVWLVRRK